jgi:hypothetical protein
MATLNAAKLFSVDGIVAVITGGGTGMYFLVHRDPIKSLILTQELVS